MLWMKGEIDERGVGVGRRKLEREFAQKHRQERLRLQEGEVLSYANSRAPPEGHIRGLAFSCFHHSFREPVRFELTRVFSPNLPAPVQNQHRTRHQCAFRYRVFS